MNSAMKSDPECCVSDFLLSVSFRKIFFYRKQEFKIHFLWYSLDELSRGSKFELNLVSI